MGKVDLVRLKEPKFDKQCWDDMSVVVEKIKADGPDAYTAVVIDQSEGFPKNQVQQIRTMFGAWLAGRTEDILESSLDQDPSQFNKKAFDSNAMIQFV